MKIIIDARMILGRIHGIARYIHESLKYYLDRGTPHEISLLSNNPEELEKLCPTGAFRVIPVKSRPFQPSGFIEIPEILRKTGGDLYYAPSISVPAWHIMPTVITIPDLTPLHTGGLFHRIYCRTVLKSAVAYSKAITTISKYIRDDVIKYLGCDPTKITVTYLAASPTPAKKVEWEEIEKKFEIEKPYLFCLSNPKPHKNLLGLIDIYNIIRKKWGGKISLVMGSRTSEDLEEKICNSPHRNEIKRIDYFEEPELDALYKNAGIFVFPSFFEGFGLPPLEAMARGIPVVSSDRTSLPEVVGDGGILVDPDNKEEFADSIISLLNDEKEWEKYSEKALKQAGKFSWEKYSGELMKVFEEAVKEA